MVIRRAGEVVGRRAGARWSSGKAGKESAARPPLADGPGSARRQDRRDSATATRSGTT